MKVLVTHSEALARSAGRVIMLNEEKVSSLNTQIVHLAFIIKIGSLK
jgi:ABC-type lipoprotein export system ATPase subunit